jgi:hypothetical protein
MADPDDSAEARAHALISRIVGLVHECREMVPELAPPARVETPSAQDERHLYLALLGALEVGLVGTVSDALAVLRQASRPLGPMGAEWLEAQECQLRPPLPGEGRTEEA